MQCTHTVGLQPEVFKTVRPSHWAPVASRQIAKVLTLTSKIDFALSFIGVLAVSIGVCTGNLSNYKRRHTHTRSHIHTNKLIACSGKLEEENTRASDNRRQDTQPAHRGVNKVPNTCMATNTYLHNTIADINK